MFKYGAQLAAVELMTIAAIYSIKYIIEFLNDRKELFEGYALFLFLVFAVTRWLAIIIRNYYDLHVFNYYRYVQTAV